MSSLIEPSSGSLLCSDGYHFTVFLTPLITSTPWATAVWRIGLPPPASSCLRAFALALLPAGNLS